MRHTLQKGFTLLELSITTVLMTMGIVAMIQLQGYQAQLEVARSVAQIYQRINNAAGGYLVNYYDVLKDVPADCSNTGMRGATMVNAPAGPPLAGCNRTLGQVNVANALQPTLDELRQLGLLYGADGAQFNNALPLPTFGGDQGNPFQMLDADGKIAAAAFGVLIQKIQTAGAQDLRSLVYNRQPFKLDGTSRAGGVLLDEMLLAAGADAYLSDNLPASAGQLRAQAGAAEPTMPNPMQVAGPNGSVMGAPFVFAMRNGYGSAGFDRYVRRDGSTPLTGNWNVGDNNITGVRTLGAQVVSVGQKPDGSSLVLITDGNINANGNIKGQDGTFSGNVSGKDGTFSGNVSGKDGTFSGNINANGNVKGQDGTFSGNVSGQDGTFSGLVKGTLGGVFGDFKDNVTAALKATSAYISGAFTVVGETLLKGNLTAQGSSLFKGDLTTEGRAELKGVTNAYSLRLQSEANLGGQCDPDLETLRKAISPQADAAVKLLVCDPKTKTWVRAQADYAGDINTIYNRLGLAEGGINNIKDSLVGINSTIDANNKSLGDRVSAIEKLNLDDRVTKLESGIIDLQKLQKTTSDTVSTLGTTVSTIANDVTTLKNNQMRWDIVNVTWPAATCYPNETIITQQNGSQPVCVAQTRVWKKTPWKCSRIGTLSAYDSSLLGGFDQVRWLQYASDNVPKLDGFSTTPPILIGMDNAPNEPVVYDVNCATTDQTYDTEAFWYVGMSAKQTNQFNGNNCRSGLGSILTGVTMSTYDGGAYENSQCKNFNALAPSFNKSVMTARFIAFSRAPTATAK